MGLRNTRHFSLTVFLAALIIAVGCGMDSSIVLTEEGHGGIVVPPSSNQGAGTRSEPSPLEPTPRVVDDETIPPVEPLPTTNVRPLFPVSPLTVNQTTDGASASITFIGANQRPKVVLAESDFRECALFESEGTLPLIRVQFESSNGDAGKTRSGLVIHAYQSGENGSFSGTGRTLIRNTPQGHTHAFNRVSLSLPGEAIGRVNRLSSFTNSEKSVCQLKIKTRDAGTSVGWIDGEVKCERLKNAGGELLTTEGKFSCPLRTSRDYPWDLREVAPGMLF